MNSQPRKTRFSSFLTPALVAGLCLGGGVSVLAFADGPIQPDPPVPLERASQVVSPDRDLDCRCAVLHARDIESRVEGHVAQWEARSRAAQLAVPASRPTSAKAHLTSLVEGIVGFPVQQFRLAADDTDDGAGSD
jgi:hypothetical protein